MRLKSPSPRVPTRPGSDLVPVRKETKERLSRLKGERSYDELIRDLLARAELPPALPLERPWPPHKQLALAELAAKRWRLATERGTIVGRGPRLVEYWTGRRERRPSNVRAA